MRNWLAGMNGIAADMLFSGGYLVAPRQGSDVQRADSSGIVTPMSPALPVRSPGQAPEPALPRTAARLAAG